MLTDNDGNVTATTQLAPWQDTSRTVDERVNDLLGRMTLEEKIAQLYSVWLGGATTPGEDVAPHQHDLVGALDWPALVANGLGQLTRPYGTAPVEPLAGAHALAGLQRQIVAASRFGIPALAHEECLSGVMAWRATCYPTPLAWGATFDPALVQRMGAQIGTAIRALGLHQGLAPVLDVTRDPRWGRTEETMGEDPYLCATLGTAYVKGMQSAGVVATLKHFVGYSASRAGRNFAPVAVGRRELADVLMLPFEMAIRDGGAGSVMPSYAAVDGVPVAADAELLTALLRDAWCFTGTVVADYFEVGFLAEQHGVAADLADAAALALTAGIDVELPSVRCYGEPLLAAVRSGAVPEALVDRAARRVLAQKCVLGLLDADWQRDADWPGDAPHAIDLDPPQARALARELAEASVVLLANDGTLPLRPPATVAVVGPLADDPYGMVGCYSFPSHTGKAHPGLSLGVDMPTVLASLQAELPGTRFAYAAGCTVSDVDRSGFGAAVTAATQADVCVAVLGDHAGLFGRGTSGEGCDVAELRLPGVQGELLNAVLATGTPVVLVMLSGRPYALGAYADRLAAVVQAFFPGEEGGPAVAGVLSGRVCPSGRLPIGVPRDTGGQPATYLTTMLGHRTDVSTVDPTPLFAFGHGLSYTAFEWSEVDGDVTEISTDGELAVSLTVRNTGDRAGVEVVQLYLHDPVAQVTRPATRLVGYARVPLDAGAARRVTFTFHADLASFTGRAGHRVVEPGDLELRLAASSVDVRAIVPVRLTGPERVAGHDRRLTAGVIVQ
jgi:beta-xylosidase